MRMRDSLISIGSVLTNDETLLRLLFYQPANYNDNPLDSSKQNVLSMSNKGDIINNHIIPTQKVDDLQGQEICRVMIYPGYRAKTGNYLVSDQEVWLDVMCHVSFDQSDYRMSWICDRLNDLIFSTRATGALGKILFKNGSRIPAPVGYIGYRLVYLYGSMN